MSPAEYKISKGDQRLSIPWKSPTTGIFFTRVKVVSKHEIIGSTLSSKSGLSVLEFNWVKGKGGS